MSPEIVSKREYSGALADIWASGVILFVLLTGTVPFKSQNGEKELFRKIQRGQLTYSAEVSPEAKTLIRSLLTVDEARRP